MCVPHDCLALPFKIIVIHKVTEAADFVGVLSALRQVCGNVTEFISLLRADKGISGSVKPPTQRLAAKSL